MLNSSINWGYVQERVRRYNENPSDDLLYRIGTHADVLEPDESIDGQLSLEQRTRILNWIADQGYKINHDWMQTMASTDYFATYIPGTEVTISVIQGQFGRQLEKLSYEEKIIFRAALSNYVANVHVYEQGSADDNDLIDTCIEGAGVCWEVWDNERLVEAIRMCRVLHESDMEILIESLSEQLRNKIYASRGAQ
ncbi:MAG TPA: hypothetical protein DCE56_29475 [Cyanobacteria bacterium UBA8553]|nr:hypothetical protein [Cyanobacteria bacterium UBA8553]